MIKKSDLSYKITQEFFQTAAVLVLLYSCTTWNLMKQLENKLDENYTRILYVVLNKSWKQRLVVVVVVVVDISHQFFSFLR